jgi:hypothetical protein
MDKDKRIRLPANHVLYASLDASITQSKPFVTRLDVEVQLGLKEPLPMA